ELRKIREMPAGGDDRIAQGVDPAAIVLKEDAERLVVAINRRPERLTRIDHPRERVVGHSPDAAGAGVERRAAPAVHCELDIAAGYPLGLRRPGRPGRLAERSARRTERERLRIEHCADDDAADDALALADAPAGAEHESFARRKRRDF